VELDEAGNPRRKSARGRQKPAANVRSRKSPPRRRPAPVKAAADVPAPVELPVEEEDLEGAEVPEVAASGGTGEKAGVVAARRPGGTGAGRRKGRGD